MYNTTYSAEQSNYSQQGYNQPATQDARANKSFIDNKPMIQGLVRSVLKVEKNGEAHLINTGLTDVDGARQIASNLFNFYNRDGSSGIDSVKVTPMLGNAYRVFNSDYNPQKDDVNSFFQTLDVDRNSKVTLDDLENLCVRYLTGTTLGVPYRFHDESRRQ